jgi:hypothetical protein
MPTGHNREGRPASVDIVAIAQIHAGDPDQTTLGATGRPLPGRRPRQYHPPAYRRHGCAAVRAVGGTCDIQRLLAQCVTRATSRCSSAVVDAIETVTLRPRWPLAQLESKELVQTCQVS